VTFEKLTLRSVEARAVLVPLRRKVVSKVGFFDQWPMILIDLHTDQGITGRSYLEPYLRQSLRYLIPAIHALASARVGKQVTPIEDFQIGQRSLNLVGYEGGILVTDQIQPGATD
jgi:mandelate racemase